MAKRKKTTTKRARARKDSAAVSVGEAIATEVLRFREQSLRRRAQAVKRLPPRARARAAAAPPELIRAAGGRERAGVLVAEGDSWFDYPWHDILRMLEDEHGYDVESVAHKGDRVEDMAYSGGQLEEFARTIEKILRQGVIPAAILLSGGGNDVAGDEFGMLINHASSPTPGFNDDVVRGIIEDRVQNAYVTIIAAVTKISRERTGNTIPILIHGYDRPVPDGRGFAGGWGPLPGPWLEPGFREKGFDDLDETTRLVGDLIDRFNRMLRNVASTSSFSHVHYLDLRGTLPNGPGYRTWWANELHPTKRGFSAVADKVAAAIARL
jgi:GDSL-like lipase/acylhydrolase family protein